jgi:hypothetical protein
MNSSALLTQVTAPEEIRSHLHWHHQQGIPLLLMCGAGEGHRPARIVDFDTADNTVQVVCSGARDFSAERNASYAAIGTTASGANFLASGPLWAVAGVQDGFKLGMPSCIDVSQSRDSERCPAPAGHFVHFCALDPHLNDVVCRVQNISRGGLAVLWEKCADNPPPVQGSLTDAAILQSDDHRVQLGKLRVAHTTARKAGYFIGLRFEQDAPTAFGSLVLDVQRARLVA